MHILVIGGSGRTGQLVISQALEQGHRVTALVRRPGSLPLRAGLDIVEGSPLERADIEGISPALDKQPPTAVIITLNSTRISENPWAATNSPSRLMADTHANIVAVAESHAIYKVVTMGAMGVGDSFPNLILFMRWLIRHSNMAYAYKGHNLVDKKMKASGINYVIARPTRLTGGEAAPVRLFGNLGKELGGFAGISRASVAAFLLDAVVQDTWDRSTPVIAN